MRAFLVSIVLLGLFSSTLAEEPKKRNIGIFNVVKFANDPCEASNSKNGTCYTAEECEDKGGTSSGSCAEGYGVCCTFTLNCGGQKAENLTYFESTNGFTGACNTRICKCADDICQLRLDFTTFVITGPNTITDSALNFGLHLNGRMGVTGGKATVPLGTCDSDQFSVTSPGGTATPVICGTNTGAHMYVEASDSCNTMSFHIADGSASTNREWAIRVTQYSCDYINKAPDGCLQYFFGAASGQVETFNFANSLHLANQNQLICVRRESNMCKICYSATDETDFKISGMVAKGALIGKAESCGNYKTDAMGSEGFDYIVIPMATKKTTDGKFVTSNADRFCGQNLAATHMGMAGKTVCSKSVPFRLRFVSDGWEEKAEIGNKGFRIKYEQFAC